MNSKKPRLPATVSVHTFKVVLAYILLAVSAFGFYRYATECDMPITQFWLYALWAAASYIALVWLWSGHGWYITIVRATLLAVPYIVLGFVVLALGFSHCFVF